MEKDNIKLFVYNLVYDVCEYFLQTVYHKFKGYLSPRAGLFSEFGHKALLKFLNKSSANFVAELQSNKSLQSVDEVSLREAAERIVETSKWKQHGHAYFFEVCGKLGILRVFSEDRGYSCDDLIYEQLVKLAVEGEELNILDVDYDRIRKFAVEVVYAVFKWQDMPLADHVTIEDLDYEEFQVPSHIVAYLESSGRALLSTIESNETLTQMNISKFKIILHYFSRTYRTTIKSGDDYVKVCELSIYIALLAVHCAKVDYKEGVELAFDAICHELSSFFKRPTAQKVKL